MKNIYQPLYQKILLFFVVLLSGQLTFAQSPPPDPYNVTQSEIFCGSLDVTLDATCDVGTPKWYLGSSPVTVLTFTVNSTSMYSVACETATESSNFAAVNFTELDVTLTTRDKVICGSTTVKLTASCPIGVVSWYENDSTTPVGTGDVITTISAGTSYVVRCEVTSPTACESPFKMVTFTDGTSSPLTLPTGPVDESICGPSGYELTATCSSGGIPFFFAVDQLTEMESAGTIIYPTADITYNVRCEDPGNPYCPSDFLTFTLTVTSPPDPVPISNPVLICKGSSEVIPATCDADSQPIWFNASGVPLPGNAVSPNVNTTYTVRCASTVSPGCYSNPVLVDVMVDDVITSHPSSVLVCLGESTSFAVSVVGSYVYQWQKKQSDGSYEDISGANSDSLKISNTTLADRGFYRCLMTGPYCTIHTEEAYLAFPEDILSKGKLVPNNVTALDEFGNSCAISGNLAIVGAWSKSSYRGAAYIYEMDVNGKWSQKAQLAPSDLVAGDSFGGSVAISGDTVFVTAPEQDSETGALYIFKKQVNNTWLQIDKIVSPTSSAGDYFGGAISVSGSLMAVGAPGVESAFIFKRDVSGVWQYNQEIKDFFGGNSFGYSVGLSGNGLVVGAPGEGIGGAIFIYERDSSTDYWYAHGLFEPSGLSVGSAFGLSAAISGNTIIAAGFEDPFGSGSGGPSTLSIVQVYEKDFTGNWVEKSRLTSDDVTDESGFGYSIAIQDNMAVIGAPANYVGRGAAIVFEKNAAGDWVQKKAIIPNDLVMGDLFGTSVAISKTSILAGAAFGSSPFPLQTSKGGAYFYSRYTYPVPAVSEVSQVAAVCSAQKATFNLTGFPNTNPYTITYKVDAAGTEKTIIITPDSLGNASFTETLVWANNTKNIFITKLKNNASGCEKVIDVNTALTLKAPTLIMVNPVPQSVCVGETAMFTAEATGEGILNFQWQRQAPATNGTNGPITGDFADISVLTLANRTIADNGAAYRVKVTGECGVAISNDAILTVLQKASVTMAAGPAVCPGTSGKILFSGTPGAMVYYESNGFNTFILLDGNGQGTVSTGAITEAKTFNLVSINIQGKCNRTISGSVTVDVLPTGASIPTAVVLTSPTDDVLNTVVQNHYAQNIQATNKINTGGKSDQKANKYVLLSPGFEASEGSVFLAKIEAACP
ncbi:3-coathanger stack domain-containing protein [Emticicia fontis]